MTATRSGPGVADKRASRRRLARRRSRRDGGASTGWLMKYTGVGARWYRKAWGRFYLGEQRSLSEAGCDRYLPGAGYGMRDDRRCVRMVELFVMGGELASTPPRAAFANRGAPYRVGVVLQALGALLRDRKADGMRFSVQIVGRARTVSPSRKTAEKGKTVSINQNSQRKGLESQSAQGIQSRHSGICSPASRARCCLCSTLLR